MLMTVLLAGCATARAPGPVRGAEARADVAATDPLLRLHLAVPPGELRPEGASVTSAERYHGALAANEYSETPLVLARGTYVVKAACDGSCQAVRLAVAADGREVARAPDDESPALPLDVAARTRYQVRVDMLRCAAGRQCGFGFAVFKLE